ncbi:hypothetical protein ACLOJK_028606 [Asimina triloba]
MPCRAPARPPSSFLEKYTVLNVPAANEWSKFRSRLARLQGLFYKKASPAGPGEREQWPSLSNSPEFVFLRSAISSACCSSEPTNRTERFRRGKIKIFFRILSRLIETEFLGGGKMEKSIPLWQIFSLSSILSWLFVSSYLGLTQKLRSVLQPPITRQVLKDTPFILRIQVFHRYPFPSHEDGDAVDQMPDLFLFFLQSFQHRFWDAFFSVLSCIVSIPFYTAFLPLLFWSGHCKLARQMTLLMAFCDYLGNLVKDVVSAPRPQCPPVRRITATEDEKENAMEYGLPSSHTLNTVCLSGYLLHYILSYSNNADIAAILFGITMVCLLVGLIGLGRIYLGMHSLVDIIGGVVMGLLILAFWLIVHKYVDSFIISGQNGMTGNSTSVNAIYIGNCISFTVTSFWASLAFLLLFAYPTPECPTPSYEFHTAFNGVALGIVSGVQQTYLQFHHEDVPHIFSAELTVPVFIGRMIVGIPTILVVKFCSKALAKWILPVVCNTMGIPIRSSCYISSLKGSFSSKNKGDSRQPLSYIQKTIFPPEPYDIDTGIRFLQYAGLAWSVVDLVPSLFSLVRL